MSVNGIKLICSNKDCINKSVVYRKPNGTRDYICKACSYPLILFRSLREKKDNIRARKELFL